MKKFGKRMINIIIALEIFLIFFMIVILMDKSKEFFMMEISTIANFMKIQLKEKVKY